MIEDILPKSSIQAYYSLLPETIKAAAPSMVHFLYQGLQSHKSLFQCISLDQEMSASPGSLGEHPVKAGREPDRKLVCYYMEHDYRFQTEIDLFLAVDAVMDI